MLKQVRAGATTAERLAVSCRLPKMCALMIRSSAAGLVLLLLACDGLAPIDPSSLAGLYAYAATGINTCTEQAVLPVGYRCTCNPPESAQGTLEITFDRGSLGGQLRFSTCAGGSCGPDETVPLVAEDQRIWSDSIAFFFTQGASPSGGSGSWFHSGRWTAKEIQGIHQRRDGNIRGCGDDFGTFTAERQ